LLSQLLSAINPTRMLRALEQLLRATRQRQLQRDVEIVHGRITLDDGSAHLGTLVLSPDGVRVEPDNAPAFEVSWEQVASVLAGG